MNTIFLESFAILVQIAELKLHTHDKAKHRNRKGDVFLFIFNRNPRAPAIRSLWKGSEGRNIRCVSCLMRTVRKPCRTRCSEWSKTTWNLQNNRLKRASKKTLAVVQWACHRWAVQPERSSNMNNRQTEPKTTALYERLSRDDELQGDSNSIRNHDVMCRGRFYPSNTSWLWLICGEWYDSYEERSRNPVTASQSFDHERSTEWI